VQQALDHLKSDAVMAAIIARVGDYRITYREPQFETLARAIVFQQLNGAAATTIFNRFKQAAGGVLTPESILKLRLPTLRKCGLSKQKIAYIRDLAQRTAKGQVDFAALHAMTDEQVIATLTQIKGIGEWTAHMFLIFALQRPDVLPTGDLGVRIAIRKAYRKRKLPTPKQMEKIAKSWHPYRSVASWYLWRSLDAPVQI
jgi:DNA-3-methyladenine glycosylase II